MIGCFKNFFIVVILVNLAACQSVTSTQSSAKAGMGTEKYVRRINKALLVANQSYIREPEVFTTPKPGSVVTHSSVCGVNDFATDSREINFLWKRYCTSAGGNFDAGTCIGPAKEVLFHTVTTIDSSCVVGSRNNVSRRKITIIEPSKSPADPQYLAELKKLGYTGQ